MGYTTKFDGKFHITKELTASQILMLQSFAQEDAREHKEWVRPRGKDGDKVGYIKWELTPDFSALEWDGVDKFYYATEALNLIILTMRQQDPEFALTGFVRAQGEELGDIWEIHIGEDGLAYRKELPKPEDIVQCPHCGEEFRLGDL